MAKDKQNIILLSKLQTPQVKTKTLFRKRLIDLLSENLNKKVILLCAGAGYGKTTLLSQFILSKDIPYVYYHLEKSDADPVVFFSYLIEGIRKVEPKIGKKTESLSHFFNYPQRYLEIIVGTFINEIIQTIKHDIYIILEDYHTLYPSEQIDKILTYLLNHLPQHLHLIISSRVSPPISMSQLRARDEIFELQTEHLRFTKEEIRNLFGSLYSIFLKESEFDWIEEHSEGWPTSLRLMLQSTNYVAGKKPSGYIRKILASYYKSQSNVFNYFAQEIYNQESKKIRQFLMDCSILEWLTPELCDAITKQKHSSNILADLTDRNAFLFRIPDMGYRFHNLFRDFLRSKIIDINRRKRLYRRAGDFCFKNNRLEDAANFYLQAEAYQKAVSVIENIGFDLIWQGRSAFLCSYIEKIPKSILLQQPSLLMNYAESLDYVSRFDEAKSNCQRAIKMFRVKPRARKQYADALYKLGDILVNQDKLKSAKKWFEKALHVCPKSARLRRASILNYIGFLYNIAGGKRNFAEATKYFHKALKIAHNNGYKDLEASILNNWAHNEFMLGNLNEAHSKSIKTVDLLKTHFSPGCGSGIYNAAKYSLFLGNKKEVRAVLDSGIKTCSMYNDMWSIATIWQGYALFHQEFGDLGKAKQFIAKALEIYEKLGVVRLIISALNEMCKINIKAGELTDAERILSKTWVLKGNRNDLEAIPILLTEAKLRIKQNKFTEAEDTLVHALKLSQKFSQTLNLFFINIELSKVFYLQGKTENVLTALTNGIVISRTKGYDYLLMRELRQEKWMLPILVREGTEKKYIQSTIKTLKLDIHWIDVFLFGVPKIIVDDCEISDSAWKTVKSKKLFFYLLLHKEEKVSQDTLVEVLWRGVSHKSGRDSLRKALQYCRETIKSSVVNCGDLIRTSKGIYQLSPQVSIRLDTEEFEELIKQAKKLKEQNGKFDNYLKRAISIYKKGFAIGWYDSWVEDLRRFYQGLYEECLLMMADFHLSKKKYKDATVWYKKLISIDFYNEEHHRKLMMVYAALDKHKEITQNFNRLKKVLKKELNADLQQETTKLYKNLIR